MKNSKEETFNEILTTKDIKKMLCVSQSTVQRMRNKGDITGYKLSGRIYYKRSEVLSALNSGKIVSGCNVAGSSEKVGNTQRIGVTNKNDSTN